MLSFELSQRKKIHVNAWGLNWLAEHIIEEITNLPVMKF